MNVTYKTDRGVNSQNVLVFDKYFSYFETNELDCKFLKELSFKSLF